MGSGAVRIERADFSDPRIVELLALHFRTMRSTGPEESCHVLPIERMDRPDLFLFAAWNGETLLGIGAYQVLDEDHAEVKSMHVREAGRRLGTGQALLDHIVAEARRGGVARLSLETGAGDFFVPARTFYEGNGFTRCGPFGAYTGDPNSAYYTRTI